MSFVGFLSSTLVLIGPIFAVEKQTVVEIHFLDGSILMKLGMDIEYTVVTRATFCPDIPKGLVGLTQKKPRGARAAVCTRC